MSQIDGKTLIIMVVLSVIISLLIMSTLVLYFPFFQNALRGPQGEQGPQGEVGPQGLQGLPGESVSFSGSWKRIKNWSYEGLQPNSEKLESFTTYYEINKIMIGTVSYSGYQCAYIFSVYEGVGSDSLPIGVCAGSGETNADELIIFGGGTYTLKLVTANIDEANLVLYSFD